MTDKATKKLQKLAFAATFIERDILRNRPLTNLERTRLEAIEAQRERVRVQLIQLRRRQAINELQLLNPISDEDVSETNLRLSYITHRIAQLTEDLNQPNVVEE